MAKKKTPDVTAPENTPEANVAETAATEEKTTEPSKKSVDASKYTYVVKNKKARALTKHKKAVVIVGIILLLLLLLTGAFYGFYRAVDINNFRIFVDSSGSKILSLAANRSMDPKSELIELIGPSNMTNTTLAHGRNIVSGFSIEDRLLDILDAEGSATTVDDYFIAGTFYVQNVTTDTKTYTERVTIEQAEKGTAKALRVMLIKNDDISVYAYPVTDEKGNLVLDEDGNVIPEEVVPLSKDSAYYPYRERTLVKDENGVYSVKISDEKTPWMTKPFYNADGNYEKYALMNAMNEIAPQEVVRYSVIIWFEGWDKDCVDSILDGEVRMTLSFACE